MGSSLLVKAIWDPDASVWVATSEDVPGLVTEAATVEALALKLRVMIPELLAANKADSRSYPTSFELVSRRRECIPLAS